jgi:hypothetical protein
MAAFIFRPYKFFLFFGLILLFISFYILIWILVNTLQIMPTIQIEQGFIDDRFSQAIGAAYRMRTHAFFIGGITLILAVQVLSLGFLSLQKKRYYEELFHLSSNLLNGINSQN